MKVVLLETIHSLGAVGDVVNVKPGYARNLLIPRGKVLIANPRNMKHIAHQQMILEHKLKRARLAAQEVKKGLETKGVTIRKKAGENEKLFGSVTAMDIEEALRAQGAVVSRKFILLEEPIKKLGKYKVGIKLDGGLEAKISVEVVGEGT